MHEASLFDTDPKSALRTPPSSMPLAARMRPRTLDEFVGQEHLVGPGRLLRTALERDELTSAIFYGPAGCGKSTLAGVIAATTRGEFETFSAVTSGVADVRRVVDTADQRWRAQRRKTILFVDEIHRFNRAQQDAFLPHVERGTVVLIGATTENPFFSVNAPLLSRARIFRFEPLTDAHLCILLERALTEVERGLGRFALQVDEAALTHFVTLSNGDARAALNGLELAALATPPEADGRRHLTLAVAEDAMQRRAVLYDREGDQHYDVVSAFIKSMRGSDPDAALYWLAKMLEAGEDPRFIARRLVIHASEDVGLADPQALPVAVAAAYAVEFVGLPEARLNLAQAVIHIATAPKSNSVYNAIERALHDVRTRPPVSVPAHLRDASYRGAARLGHGVGYRYPHDYPGHVVAQEYLPPTAKSCAYYVPSENGFEQGLGRRFAGGAPAQEGAAMNLRMETIEHESGVSVVNLSGELDMNTAPDLRMELGALAERERPLIAVNLAQVPFVDSTGLGVLSGGGKRAQERGGKLVVFSASERLCQLFTMTGLDEVFATVSTLDEALAALTRGGE